MQKKKYKNQNQFTKKIIIFTIVICLTFILMILMAILSNIQKENQEKEQGGTTENFSSVEEILRYYGCKFIKSKNSTEEEFVTDIYTNFKLDLYDNEQSNEEFYNTIINAVAQILNYTNFRIIDEGKQEKIEIRVIGDGSRVQKIYINGVEDYFIYRDSQISLSKYKEIKTTGISIQSSELTKCIQNDWSADTNFGTRETIFQDYYIYFDEGIETRKISGKIYNIIFTKNYVKPVVNGFTVGEKHDIIIRELGNPTFQNEDKTIIGYKTKDVYVFFEEDQISIYRNTKESGFDEFFELTDKFLNDEYTLLEFMNELTYIWPDYDEYIYDSETIFLSYPNKGIEIKMNYDNTNGIIVYNNIGVDQDKINAYFKYTEFIAMLQVDNVYNAEIRRVNTKLQFPENCKQYREKYEENEDKNRGEIYDYYMKMSKDDNIMCAYFISQNSQYPNCELSESIKSYIWLNDYYFVYSVAKKGIYYYDLRTQIKGVIITGDADFEIKSYENNILKYDDTQLEIRY